MADDFSPTLPSYEAYSPTRRAGWGLNPGLRTFELKDWILRRCPGTSSELLNSYCWVKWCGLLLGNVPIVVLNYADQYSTAPFCGRFVHAYFDCLRERLEHEQFAWWSRHALLGVCFWFCISICFAKAELGKSGAVGEWK